VKNRQKEKEHRGRGDASQATNIAWDIFPLTKGQPLEELFTNSKNLEKKKGPKEDAGSRINRARLPEIKQGRAKREKDGPELT